MEVTTNEEVVSNLIKNLKSEQTKSKNDFNYNTSVITCDDSHDSEADYNINDDYVDEKSLEPLQATLTIDEKHFRHEKALQFKKLGNDDFRRACYRESMSMYTKALNVCPPEYTDDRAVFYCNRSASKMQLQQIEGAIKDCTKAIELNNQYVRAYIRRAKLYEDTDQLDECFNDYKRALEIDPNIDEAHAAVIRLSALLNERNEKMKGEMLGR